VKEDDPAPDGVDVKSLLDAGHIYSPRFRSSHWLPCAGTCCHAVHDDFGVGFHQCSHKAKVKRTVKWHGKAIEAEYCATHDPVKVKERRDARDAKWRAEWEAKNKAIAESRRKQNLQIEALEAIKQIAKGHNDPRSLALEVLASHGEEL